MNRGLGAIDTVTAGVVSRYIAGLNNTGGWTEKFCSGIDENSSHNDDFPRAMCVICHSVRCERNYSYNCKPIDTNGDYSMTVASLCYSCILGVISRTNRRRKNSTTVIKNEVQRLWVLSHNKCLCCSQIFTKMKYTRKRYYEFCRGNCHNCNKMIPIALNIITLIKQNRINKFIGGCIFFTMGFLKSSADIENFFSMFLYS